MTPPSPVMLSPAGAKHLFSRLPGTQKASARRPTPRAQGEAVSKILRCAQDDTTLPCHAEPRRGEASFFQTTWRPKGLGPPPHPKGAGRSRLKKRPRLQKEPGTQLVGTILTAQCSGITAWPSSRSADTSPRPLSEPERTASRRAPGRRSSGRRNGSRPSGRTDSPRWEPWSP